MFIGSVDVLNAKKIEKSMKRKRKEFTKIKERVCEGNALEFVGTVSLSSTST